MRDHHHYKFNIFQLWIFHASVCANVYSSNTRTSMSQPCSKRWKQNDSWAKNNLFWTKYITAIPIKSETSSVEELLWKWFFRVKKWNLSISWLPISHRSANIHSMASSFSGKSSYGIRRLCAIHHCYSCPLGREPNNQSAQFKYVCAAIMYRYRI